MVGDLKFCATPLILFLEVKREMEAERKVADEVVCATTNIPLLMPSRSKCQNINITTSCFMPGYKTWKTREYLYFYQTSTSMRFRLNEINFFLLLLGAQIQQYKKLSRNLYGIKLQSTNKNKN